LQDSTAHSREQADAKHKFQGEFSSSYHSTQPLPQPVQAACWTSDDTMVALHTAMNKADAGLCKLNISIL
jgi:hypothetical protein